MYLYIYISEFSLKQSPKSRNHFKGFEEKLPIASQACWTLLHLTNRVWMPTLWPPSVIFKLTWPGSCRLIYVHAYTIHIYDNDMYMLQLSTLLLITPTLCNAIRCQWLPYHDILPILSLILTKKVDMRKVKAQKGQMEHSKAHFHISRTGIQALFWAQIMLFILCRLVAHLPFRGDQLLSYNPRDASFSSNASSDNETRLIFGEVKKDST